MQNNDFQNDNKTKVPSKSATIKELLHHFAQMLLHNWGWKLTCVVISIALWGGILMQDETMMRPKQIDNVTINVHNEDVLRRNGYIVVSGLEEENLSNVRIKVDVPQKYFNQVTAQNYNVRVDLNKIRSAGEQKLNVITTSTSTYGNVTDVSVKQISVMVEEYVPRSRIPVRLDVQGNAPDGYYAAAASVDPQYIEIAGPKSLVEKVTRCAAQYDMSILPAQVGTERSAVPFVLYDRNNNVVDTKDIDAFTGGVYIDSITVEQTLYVIRPMAVSTVGLTTGQPKEGYEIKSIVTEPALIDIAFTDNDFDSVTHLYPADIIDIEGKDSAVVQSITVTRPQGTKYMSDDEIFVTVNIGKIEE